MEFKLYIDGVDAYDAYRLSVSDGGYKDFVCFPKLKEVAYNDWHEQNGIDPDLSEPKLDAREITVGFHIVGSLRRYYELMRALSDGAYHLFGFVEIGLEIKLRLSNSGKVKSTGNLHAFTLTFIDDSPLEGYDYDGPTTALIPRYDYLVDGRDISDYGVRVLQGTFGEIIKQPDVKENLKINMNHLSGQSYDGKNVTYKSRTVALKCFMRGRDLMEFWRNWKAFLYDLTRPDSRILKVTMLNKDIPFYYKNCSVDSFHPDKGKIWFEFTLNVEFYKGVI